MWQITFSCCYTNSSYSQNKIYKYWTTHNLNKKFHPPHFISCHIYCLMVGFSSKYLIIISKLSLKTKLDRTSYDLLSLAEPSVRYCEFRLQHRGSGVIMVCCLFIKHHRPVIYGRPLHYLPEGLNFHSWKATVVVFFYIWEKLSRDIYILYSDVGAYLYTCPNLVGLNRDMACITDMTLLLLSVSLNCNLYAPIYFLPTIIIVYEIRGNKV